MSYIKHYFCKWLFYNGVIMTIAHCTDSKTILSAAYDKAIQKAKATSGFEHYKDLLKSRAYEIALKHYHKIKNTPLSDDNKDLLEKLHNIVQSYINIQKRISSDLDNANINTENKILSKQFVFYGKNDISYLDKIDISLYQFLYNSRHELQQQDDLIGEMLLVHDYNEYNRCYE